MKKLKRHSGLAPESNKWIGFWHKARMTSLNDWFLLLLPIAVWLSYHPLLELGGSDTMYLEFSVTLICLLLFSVTAIPHLWRARREIVQKKSIWLVSAFAIWNSISVLWSENPLRGFLTAGVIWLLVIAFARIISHPKIKQLLPSLFKIFVISAVVVSIFAWLQMILDIAGVPMEDTLVCVGCQYRYFGFPRAVGFAIEPQFFGSLLLAPILLLTHLAFKKKVSKMHYVVTGFLALTLFMTLSRGAIYALAIGVLLLLVVSLRGVQRRGNPGKRQLDCHAALAMTGTVFVAFVLSLVTQGTMVALNPEVFESFEQGVAKSIHHLSLGTIDFRQKNPSGQYKISMSDEIEVAKDNLDSPVKPANDVPDGTIYFDGYVAESTEARLSFNELAFDAWKSSPQSILFGVGLGDSGVAMHNTHPDQIGKLEITQNEYTEIPLELGLVGMALFVAMLAAYTYQTRQQKWIWSVMAAFLVQWMFFSGYPNAIHIYLTLFILLLFARERPKSQNKLFEKYSIFGKIA